MCAELKAVLGAERLTLRRRDPRGVLARKPRQWDGDIGVWGYKPSVEGCETQERLDVRSFSWCRSVTGDLDRRGVHSKAVRANNKSEAVRRAHAESALPKFDADVAHTKASQDLAYMYGVLVWVVRVDQDVI